MQHSVELAKIYVELRHNAKGSWRGAKLPFQLPCPDRPQLSAPKKD